MSSSVNEAEHRDDEKHRKSEPIQLSYTAPKPKPKPKCPVPMLKTKFCLGITMFGLGITALGLGITAFGLGISALQPRYNSNST